MTRPGVFTVFDLYQVYLSLISFEVVSSAQFPMRSDVSSRIYAVPDSCCIVTRRLVESVGEVFDRVASSAIAVFEHVKDKLAVIPCFLRATL